MERPPLSRSAKNAALFALYVERPSIVYLADWHWIRGGRLPSLGTDASAAFPLSNCCRAVFSFMLTFGSLRTLFQEADIVFLLPAETKLGPYIQRAFLLSFLLQAYGLLLIWLAVAPLHQKFSDVSIWRLFLVLLVLKGWNLFISWKGNYFIESLTHRLSALSRFGLNAAFVYFLLADASFFFLLAICALMAGITFYVVQATKRKGWKWERIIEQEAKAVRAFYRIANLFTDVPQWKEEAKRRRWLDFLISMIPYQQKIHFFIYMCGHSSVRADISVFMSA